jgi:hypothetical protein
MAATGGDCLNLHASPGACYTLKEKKIVKSLEESMGWGYDQSTGHITYGTDECIWPQYGLPIQGTEIVGTTCKDTKTDQRWKQKKLEEDHEGYYQYEHKDSGRCMTLNKDKVILRKCNAGDGNQHWKFGGIGAE